ncbi:AraC family transcriptional regulator ligand-binding domain-containing protein [Zavarzinia sp. CC-PAN008]|uniref:AraC family transcriptional regulator n=1 Tax=Zavarzinia sp. CC-PAN008 TaxID=3243332 RepID=UPI003F746353
MSDVLARLPMTMGYFRLVHRAFVADSARVLEGTGITQAELDDPTADITVFQQVRQVENVAALHGPGWVFLQPHIWTAATYGAPAIAVIAAPTIGDGLAVLARYAHVRTPWIRARLRASGEALVLDWDVTVALSQAQWRPMMEVTFLMTRSLVQAALGAEPPGLAYAFAAPRPDYAPRVAEVLGPRVRYDAAANQVIVPRALAEVRSIAADPQLHLYTIAGLEAHLARLDDPSIVHSRVERLLQTMPDGRPGAEFVARSLGLSRRSLTRHLGAAGVRYRDLLDAELRARAIRLRGARVSRYEIAARLGYQDPSSFSRAWRRWFGEGAE